MELLKIQSASPFIKWAGGKTSIMSELLSRVPYDYDSYYEPFLGGGSLFFRLRTNKYAELSDINSDLVTTYMVIKSMPEDLIPVLEKHRENHSKEYYYHVRDMEFKKGDDKGAIQIAARFIYRNKTCFNGLYRVNKKGKFNVPIGSYKNPKIFSESHIMSCCKAFSKVFITERSYEDTPAKQGSFVYLDPPYYNTFSDYSSGGFGEEEHEKLAEFCKKLNKNGVMFMLSNSDEKFVKKLYNGFKIEVINDTKKIACKTASRKKKTELIIRNYENI